MDKKFRKTDYILRIFMVISISIFGLIAIIGSAPSSPNKKSSQVLNYLPVSRTYNASFNDVWRGVISSISNIEWETEYLDKDSGVIKFKTSYLIIDFTSNDPDDSVRIYRYPREIDAKYGNSKPWLRKYTYYDESLSGNIKFTKQNLIIKIVKISASKTRVDIKFHIEGTAFWSGKFYPESNRLFETTILDAVKHII